MINEIRKRIADLLNSFLTNDGSRILNVSFHRDTFTVGAHDGSYAVSFMVIADGNNILVKVTEPKISSNFRGDDHDAATSVVKWISGLEGHTFLRDLMRAPVKVWFEFQTKMEIIYSGKIKVLGTNVDEAAKLSKRALQHSIPSHYNLTILESSASITEETLDRSFRVNDFHEEA